MKLFPAIDLYNKKVVRLTKGKFDSVQEFNDQPLQVAKKYETEGATWLHIIDLNGAETGDTINYEVIKEIVSETKLKVQVGGGIRSIEKIDQYLAIGINRVILGSFAVENINDLDQIANKYKEKVIVSVDSINDYVTYAGWQDISSYHYIDFCRKVEESGIKTIVYTDIAKDGMMEGTNLQHYEQIQETTSLNVIASGGVSTMDDIIKLNQLKMYGAIVGKALYLNKLSVKEMVRCLQEE